MSFLQTYFYSLKLVNQLMDKIVLVIKKIPNQVIQFVLKTSLLNLLGEVRVHKLCVNLVNDLALTNISKLMNK